MPRSYKFDAVFEHQEVNVPQSITIEFNENYDAAEIFQTIPGPTLEVFFELLNEAEGGKEPAFEKEILERKNALKYTLPNNTIKVAWHVVAIINLISFATFLDEGDTKLKFLNRVLVAADQFADAKTDQLLEVLESSQFNADVRYSEHFVDEDGLWPEWPDNAEDFSFRIELKLSKTPPAEEGRSILRAFQDITNLISWAALVTNRQPEELVTHTEILFPSTEELSGNTLILTLEYPTSNFSLFIDLFIKIVKNSYGITVTGLLFEVEEL